MYQLLKKAKNYIISTIRTKEENRHALVGPPKLWKMKRDFQIKFLKDMGLQPKHSFFEIGCGTLRGGIPIIEYLDTSNYFGAEVRKKALKEGKNELKDSGLEWKNPTLILSPDISNLSIDQNFDYIWSFSVLFHMNDKIVSDTFNFVSKHLSNKGVFYANVNIGDSKENNWQGFPVVSRNFDFYSQICAINNLTCLNLGSLKNLGHISHEESQDNQTMLEIKRT